MRSSTAALLALVLSLPGVAAAIEVGKPAFVVRDVPLQTEFGAVPLTAGSVVQVRAVDGTSAKVYVAGRRGALSSEDLATKDEALALFSKRIADEPQNAAAWRARGKVRFSSGEHPQAQADFDESLKLEPNSEALTLRGFSWKRSGNKEKAMADINEALRLDPKNALAWRVRGATFAGLAEYDKALADYSKSIEVDPHNPESLHHRVVMLSACKDDKIRDGKQAVKDATHACEVSGWDDALFLAGLAMAYAELGDFDSAIKWQTKVVEKMPIAKANLELYREHKPFRMTWR